MGRLDPIYDITRKIDVILNQPITAKNREQVIGEVTTYIEQRGQTMENLTPPFSEKEKMLGKEIVILNERIDRKMESLFEALKKDMRMVNKQKESSRSYINPYGQIKSTDGMYHDSKQ